MNNRINDYKEARNKTSRAVLTILLVLAIMQLSVSMWKITCVSQTFGKWSAAIRGIETVQYLRMPASIPKCNTSAIWSLNDSVVSVKNTPPSWVNLERDVTTNHPGGHFKPVSCNPQHRVAIVIPYRNRESQLLSFLQHMHPFLQRQLIEYRIFVIELVANITFNRAMLMNIGFIEAGNTGNFTCFIFHDVDLLPEDIRNLYICNDQPRHLTVAVDKFKYRLPYRSLIGGACAFTERQFRKVNGFSNKYFGWGGEDDDLYLRIRYRGMNVTRYPVTVARYKMIKHRQEKASPVRGKLLEKARTRIDVDGLNSLQYKVLQKSDNPLYTWILVSVNPILYGHNVKIWETLQKKPSTGKKANVNGNAAKKSTTTLNKTVNGKGTSVNTRLDGHAAKNSITIPNKNVNGKKH